MIKNLTGSGRRGRSTPPNLQEQVDPYKVKIAKALKMYFKENPEANIPTEESLNDWIKKDSN